MGLGTIKHAVKLGDRERGFMDYFRICQNKEGWAGASCYGHSNRLQAAKVQNRCTRFFRTEVYRARYFNPGTGRFWTMDTDQGDKEDPLSLHKYLYCQVDPINGMDPSGNEDLDSMRMPVLAKAFATTIDGLEKVGGVPAAAAQYSVVLVTPSNGIQYKPQTKLKTQAQANEVGLPVGTPVYISVPPQVDPQALVDFWRPGNYYSGRHNTDFGVAFADFWRPHGAHDYKEINPIYDAFGNFGFGATGAANGDTLENLLAWANRIHKLFSHGPNPEINNTDIKSGFNAISQGGKLSVVRSSLQ
jgi:RHS repeat-associated protein